MFALLLKLKNILLAKYICRTSGCLTSRVPLIHNISSRSSSICSATLLSHDINKIDSLALEIEQLNAKIHQQTLLISTEARTH